VTQCKRLVAKDRGFFSRTRTYFKMRAGSTQTPAQRIRSGRFIHFWTSRHQRPQAGRVTYSSNLEQPRLGKVFCDAGQSVVKASTLDFCPAADRFHFPAGLRVDVSIMVEAIERGQSWQLPKSTFQSRLYSGGSVA
jgi:hypothetical protein